ncbi:MAG: ABC transporter permease [Planctomycetes bacterium]|nr:ABC transporter permease [Planctomycetota bacterium]
MKTIIMIAKKSLARHKLSTSVTAGSLALACGLVIGVFSIQEQSYQAFTTGAPGFDAVLGARGSQLQLVMNSVLHLDTSPGNIPYKAYTEMRDDPRVKLAVPYAVGDNYRGYRVVGTTPELLTEFELSDGVGYQIMPGGRVFDDLKMEAVVGSQVARKTGLRVGSHLHFEHGVEEEMGHDHEDEYIVVGILEPTNTPADKVIWCPLEGMYRLDGHVLRGGGEVYIAKPDEEIPDEVKEVSAVMLAFKSPQAGFQFSQQINGGKDMTLAWPIARAMAQLFDKIGWAHKVLSLVAYLVCVVGAASILASLYNAMNERRREFAILRALGARRSTVFGAILTESTAIAALGGLMGLLVYGLVFTIAAQVIRAEAGIVLDIWQLHSSMWLAPLGVTLLGALAGIVPAMKAYRTDVATHIVAHS